MKKGIILLFIALFGILMTGLAQQPGDDKTVEVKTREFRYTNPKREILLSQCVTIVS